MITSFSKVLMTKTVGAVVTALFSLLVADSCFAHETLFYKASRNYGEEGSLGTVYRSEFESRMFTHLTWSERLYLSYDNPDIDETLEVYSKPDGSWWLNYRRAVPSLSRLIRSRLFGANFNLKRELDAVQIIYHDVALPQGVASQIRLLWRTMLSGLAKPPPEKAKKQGGFVTRTIYFNSVVIIGFAKENNTVKTGSVPMNMHKTQVYREFGAIIDGLIKASERGAGARDPIWAQLLERMRSLRLLLDRRS
jgi:hypothetical protein